MKYYTRECNVKYQIRNKSGFKKCIYVCKTWFEIVLQVVQSWSQYGKFSFKHFFPWRRNTNFTVSCAYLARNRITLRNWFRGIIQQTIHEYFSFLGGSEDPFKGKKHFRLSGRCCFPEIWVTVLSSCSCGVFPEKSCKNVPILFCLSCYLLVTTRAFERIFMKYDIGEF
jgi:hypothetical protein